MAAVLLRLRPSLRYISFLDYFSLCSISILGTQLKFSVAGDLINPLLSLTSPRTLLGTGL